MKPYIRPVALVAIMAILLRIMVGCSGNSGEAPVGGCTLMDDSTTVCGETEYKFY